MAEDYRMAPRRTLALALVVVAFGIRMYGLMALDWRFREIGSLSFWMGIAIPMAGGLPAGDTHLSLRNGSDFVESARLTGRLRP